MDKLTIDANKDFWGRYNRYMALVQKAGGIEILIRIVTQISSTSQHFMEKDFKSFEESSYKHDTKSYDKLINEYLPKHKDQFQKIRLIADAVAHADLIKARDNIIAYGKKYKLKQTPSDKAIGLIYMNNIIDESGVLHDRAYIVDSSPDNLLTEEMEVFEKQGYALIAESIFDEAKSSIDSVAKNIAIVDLTLKTKRGLKYGVLVEK
jgi:hypothetical protein